MQELKWRVQRLLSIVTNFFKYVRQVGLKKTLRASLDYLGIRNYIHVEYPIKGIRVMVEAQHFLLENTEGRQWEFDCLRHILKLVKEGQILLDVGASIGQYTMMFAKLVQDNGRVYAFEPDLKALDILRHNVTKNGLNNVSINGCAISNCCGEAKLKSCYAWGDTMSSLVDLEFRKSPKEIVVKTSTIDHFCEENGIHPDGIKIDVEGAEALVVEGCRNVIKKYSPWVLLEFHGNFMSEEDRRTNWYRIVDAAKEVTFIKGASSIYHYGSKLISMPDCQYCHVFIEY